MIKINFCNIINVKQKTKTKTTSMSLNAVLKCPLSELFHIYFHVLFKNQVK